MPSTPAAPQDKTLHLLVWLAVALFLSYRAIAMLWRRHGWLCHFSGSRNRVTGLLASLRAQWATAPFFCLAVSRAPSAGA